MTTVRKAQSKTDSRTSIVERNTAETRIAIHLTIEGRGQYKVATGIRFFDHMLELFTRHGAFDLELKCDGDLDVDQHHTVEDVGIAPSETSAAFSAPDISSCRWMKPSPSLQLT